jgi:hypothetical protein
MIQNIKIILNNFFLKKFPNLYLEHNTKQGHKSKQEIEITHKNLLMKEFEGIKNVLKDKRTKIIGLLVIGFSHKTKVSSLQVTG